MWPIVLGETGSDNAIYPKWDMDSIIVCYDHIIAEDMAYTLLKLNLILLDY